MTALTILAGSVYGNAQHAADTVASALGEDGIDCTVLSDPQVSDVEEAEALLVITSTTGQGDIPPNLELVFAELREQFPLLNRKPFAVAALGDSSYGDTYCGAGVQWHELLTELQGKPVADVCKVDAMESLEPEKDVTAFVTSVKDELIS
ncbi:flavodoxin domain-containing protein [Alteromonas sp. C1M14]|uniref:flavodoxin domain-containing protein n=1 Tax=Alteromonas sp. C1M14 TaxID=2841567 RepID=UPI001C097553|nr:flavodoxin domain-containing protein [Alteromonas sp. C1M14]MBU2977858.1 flavodoxin domain-containing protein [Alteromonas sp. C1M14]